MGLVSTDDDAPNFGESAERDPGNAQLLTQSLVQNNRKIDIVVEDDTNESVNSSTLPRKKK